MNKIIGLFIIVVSVLVGCGNQSDTQGTNDDQIKVVTTIAQIADIVENVGGDQVAVTSLMGPGTDPHMYNAVQGDIQKLENADIILYNGLFLEGQMGEIFAQMETDKPTIAVAEEIPVEYLLNDPDSPSVIDPHVWFDVTTWSYVVEAVRDQLIEFDPDNKNLYDEHAESYLAELSELDGYINDRIAEIPEESRVLVTAHDAFNYFGEAYGFEVVGLQGLSTDADYSVRDIQDIIDLLVERDIKAVFIESSVSDRSINAVVEGAQDASQEVVIGGELYSDAMGEAGTDEGTYIGMFKANINTIIDSLK